MKRLLIFISISLFVFSVAGCRLAVNNGTPFASIKTYRDIPGITREEIAAIEALKTARSRFSYGTLLSAEAFILPDGTYAGFAIQFCDLLSELFGISFVQELYEWDELIEKLESQSLDFTGELTPTEDRMRKYDMSFPIAERLLRIYMHVDSDKIQNEADINGLNIGFLEDTITAASIRKAYPVLFNSVSVTDYSVAAGMLASGEIDAFIDEAVADPAFEEYDFVYSTIFFPMIHESVSMTTANPELAPVISAINKYIAAGGIDRLYELYKEGDFEYSKYKLQRLLTDEERAYIDDLKQRGEPVAFALTHDNYPVNFFNQKEKQFQGIAVDVLTEISRLIGIQFQAAAGKETIWMELFESVKTGELPMIAELLYSEARKNQFIWSAVPYSRSSYVIMSKVDFPNLASYQIMRHSVGVLKQSGHEDIYHELFPDYNNLVEYNTQEECLDALERGEVTLLMASEYMLLAQIHYREKPGFKINVRLDVPLESYFGFYRDEAILCSIIDKAQSFVQTDIIEVNWTSRVFDYSRKIAEHRAVLLMSFVSVLSLLLIAAIFLLVNNIKLSKRLEEIASHDALTGILNRRYFMELGLTQIDRSLRLKKECFLIMFDLDHFKLVNDTHGHQAGDKVLKEITQRVKKAVRPYDLFGRYGGEEFVILMFDTDTTNVYNATDRIRQDVCKTPVDFENIQIPISASFGIALVAPKNDMETAIKHADDALYRAKEEGRNRVVFYEGDDKT